MTATTENMTAYACHTCEDYQGCRGRCPGTTVPGGCAARHVAADLHCGADPVTGDVDVDALESEACSPRPERSDTFGRSGWAPSPRRVEELPTPGGDAVPTAPVGSGYPANSKGSEEPEGSHESDPKGREGGSSGRDSGWIPATAGKPGAGDVPPCVAARAHPTRQAS